MIGSEFVGGFMNLANTAFSNYLNEEAANRARAENYKYNEMAADAADKRQRQQFWDLYSIGSQMQQIKNAGLSPSLMYGGTPSPGGSATGAQGGGGGNIMPTRANYSLEGALLAAQIKNLNAAAEKTNEEAKTIKGENTRGAAEVAGILAENGLKTASTRLTSVQADISELEKYIKDATKETSIKHINKEYEYLLWQTEKVFTETEQAGLQLRFDIDTYEKRKEELVNNVMNIAKEIALKDQKIKESQAMQGLLLEKTNAIVQQVYQSWVDLCQKETAIKNQKEYWEGALKNAETQIANDQELRDRGLDIQTGQLIVSSVLKSLELGLKGAAMFIM